MATKRWTGAAKSVTQIDTLTPGGTIEAGDIFIVTINGKTVTYSATSTTVASVCTGMVAALQACTEPEFEEITWADAATTITATAVTAGKPFTVTATTTESNGDPADAQTFTRAASTACSGPNFWSVAANWDTGTIPANSDDIYFSNSSVDCLYDLDQNTVTLTSLHIENSFTGHIGLPDWTGTYYEYREKYLKISATTEEIGYGPGSGSSLIRRNAGTVQTALTVLNSGTSDEQFVETILWKGTNASNVVNIYKGSVGVAVKPGETAVIATLRVGYVTNAASDSQVRCGSGVTLTTINQAGGDLEISSNATTVTMTNGELTVNGSATVTTYNLDGGRVIHRSTGTITTAKVGSDAELDFSQNMSGRTVTNCTLEKGAKLTDPFRTVTFTNPFTLNRCGVSEVELDLGSHITLQRANGA